MGILPMNGNRARHGQDAHATVRFPHGKGQARFEGEIQVAPPFLRFFADIRAIRGQLLDLA
jgi:hypothetical protein